MTYGAGAAIYVGIKPLLKVFLNCLVGFILGKKGVLSPQTSQDISIIVVNFLSPCLVFNKIVTSISTKDIVSLAVMELTAILYIAIGAVFAITVKTFTPNPKYWMGGLFLLGSLTNAGDLPIAYITTFVTGSTFSADDGAKGIAYCTIFMSNLSFFLYNLGMFRLVERDYKLESIDREAGSYNNHCRSGISFWLEKRKNNKLKQAEQQDLELNKTSNNGNTNEPRASSSTIDVAFVSSPSMHRKNSQDVETTVPITSDKDYDFDDYDEADEKNKIGPVLEPVMTVKSDMPVMISPPKPGKIEQWFLDHRMWFAWELLVNFIRPPSLALIIGLFCALIPPIRKLFYVGSDAIESMGAQNISAAPDGLPVLGFIMDFTGFVGNALVPLGLLLLGATAGRLKVQSMPEGFWKSSVLMCVLKLVVLPIIAIAWCSFMKQVGWLDHSNKLAQLVMILNSGVPGPTMIIYLTAIYQPKEREGSEQMDCLAICLIMQYITITVTMTTLLAYTITNVIHL